MTEVPLDPNEFVLRRIHPNNFQADLAVPILRCEFEPKPRDVDGISLYREQFTTGADLAKSGRSAGGYYIARFLVSDLLDLGLSVVPTPGDLPGHVSVPELSFQDFCANRQASKEIQRKLAELAAQNIIHRPESERASP